MGVVREWTGDLMTSVECLAHCVSADLHMNAGVARVIKHRFGGVRELLSQHRGVGQVAYLHREGRIIFYLITKSHFLDFPTVPALRSCLRELAFLCWHFKIHHLSVSRLGCGLDRLKWVEVKHELEMAFCNLDIIINVYSL